MQSFKNSALPLSFIWKFIRSPVVLLVFSSVNLDDDDDMDTSPQSIFIIDKQPMDMADVQASLQQQEEEDLEDSENREDLLDEDESVSTSKSAHVNGMKPNGVNRVVDGGQVSSEESEDEDYVMEITTKSLPTESTDSDPSKTADIRWLAAIAVNHEFVFIQYLLLNWTT